MTRAARRAAAPPVTPARPLAAAALVLGAWATVVPYVAAALGFELDVARRVEFVDHVVPGVVAIAGAAWLVAAKRGGEPTVGALAAAGACVLAAFWITATHVGLLIDAAQGTAPAGASLLHGTAGPALLLVAGWLLARLLRAPD